MGMPIEEEVDVEVKEGDVLAGKYRVEKILGAGGMGVVVAATHIVLHDRVALKFLLPSVAQHETTAARFLREAQAAVKIKSPHVARVIDVGTMEDTGSPYMVMEYLEGKDLSELIELEGPLDAGLACLYILQGCEALAAAHASGVVHRDIKPANMFVTLTTDGAPTIKVLDFGISKVTNDLGVSNLTQTQVSMGSPLYMSPEQMRSARDVDHRADIWSLGVVLYELLTGTLPFVADSMPQLCALVLETTAPPMQLVRPDLPDGLEPVVARCLAKDPNDRYKNVGELAQSLGPFAGDLGIASAARSARIVSGSSIGNRTVSGVEAPRQTLSSVPGAASAVATGTLSVATATSFGRTGSETSPEPQKTNPVLYAVAAVLMLGLGGALYGLSGSSGSSAASPVDPGAHAAEMKAARAEERLREAEKKIAAAEAMKNNAGDEAAKKTAEEAAAKAEKMKQEAVAEQKEAEKEAKKEFSDADKRRWAEAAKRKKAAEAAAKAAAAPKEEPKPESGGVYDTRK